MLAVVMAGGLGARLKPLTEAVPKPMLNVGNKPILEIVIRKLKREGFSKIIITIGYKGEMIKSYFGDGSRFGLQIDYTSEKKRLGTVGALSLIDQPINEPILIINGDILTKQNLSEIMAYHLENKADLTVGIVNYQQKIPYGVIKRDHEILEEIEEKPDLYIDIGAGIYVISPEVLSYIEKDVYMDFPDLVKKVKNEKKVICFNIDGYWKDIGRLEDYREVNEDQALLSSLEAEEQEGSLSEEDISLRTIPLANPNLSIEEAKAVYDTILSNWVTQGPKVKEFEEIVGDYVGCQHAVALFNGTVALHAILVALGIKEGDEVIVPSITFASTATSVLFVGADVVFADIDPLTFNLDPMDTERRITERTKAIMVVHYAGQSANMDAFVEIARKYNLFLIEDAAEAIGAHYKGQKVGTFGDAAMFSFTPTKNITTGEGGIVTTNDDKLAEKIRLLRNHGQAKQYEHVMVGYNYRMTDMQGAIGVEQMKKLDSILERKIGNAQYLSKQLEEIEGIIPPYQASDRNHTFTFYTVRVDQRKIGLSRDDLIERLQERGIQTKIYFPPLHTQPIFAEKHEHINLPVTERICKEMLSLPMYAKLTNSDTDYIVESLRKIYQECAR